jgi:hypothetical protein
MLNKYRLFQRADGVFYWQDNESSKQGTLRTKDRKAAEKLRPFPGFQEAFSSHCLSAGIVRL